MGVNPIRPQYAWSFRTSHRPFASRRETFGRDCGSRLSRTEDASSGRAPGEPEPEAAPDPEPAPAPFPEPGPATAPEPGPATAPEPGPAPAPEPCAPGPDPGHAAPGTVAPVVASAGSSSATAPAGAS